MKKYQRNYIGFTVTTNEGYKLTVIDGGTRKRYCTVLLDGVEFEARTSIVKHGAVKNRLHPSVYGVGCIGHGKYACGANGKRTKSYKTWQSMLSRCYDDKYHEKMPTYKDCSVHSDWHNFQVFAEWFEHNYIEGFHLDKDKLVSGNRIYSADTCCFLSSQENIEVSQSKHYTFLSPQGEVVKIFNLNKFCRDKGLVASNMLLVLSGKRKHCNGWKMVNEN